jgi:uncharacterized protein YaiI (UPF0178 family)
MPPAEFNVWVDGDDCQLQTEIVRVCKRYGIVPRFVYNKIFAYYTDSEETVVLTVPGDFDSAETCILGNLLAGDLVLTDNAILALGALRKGAAPLDFRGRWLTENYINEQLAARESGDSHQEEEVSKRPREKPARAERLRLRRQLNAYLKFAAKAPNPE